MATRTEEAEEQTNSRAVLAKRSPSGTRLLRADGLCASVCVAPVKMGRVLSPECS